MLWRDLTCWDTSLQAVDDVYGARVSLPTAPARGHQTRRALQLHRADQTVAQTVRPDTSQGTLVFVMFFPLPCIPPSSIIPCKHNKLTFHHMLIARTDGDQMLWEHGSVSEIFRHAQPGLQPGGRVLA